MNVLVTGAGGFLGQEVVARLLDRGHWVRAMVRANASNLPWADKVDLVRADLRVVADFGPLLDNIDIIVHLASATSGNEDVQFASTVVGTERLVSAMAKSKVRKLVLASSFVVYDWAQAKGTMDERTPLLAKPYDMGGYTIAKVWQERVVRRAAQLHDWDLRVVRPGFIWGPSHTNIAGMGRRVGPFHLAFAPFAQLPLTHVMNCADCIVAVTESPAAAGETFNIVDSNKIRIWRYAREYSRRSGERRLVIPVPYYLGLLVAKMAAFVSRLLFGENGKLPSLLTPRRYEAQFKPIRYSTEKLRRALNWTSPLSFKECLAKSYRAED